MSRQGSYGVKGRRYRRTWSVEEKRSLVLCAFAEGTIVSQVARKAALSPSQLYKWRSDMAIDQADSVTGAGAVDNNVTGSLGSLVQNAAMNVLQGLTVQQNATSETACAGSAAGGSGNCGSAAMGAAASVALNDLIAVASGTKNPAVDASGKPITSEQQLATEDIVSTLVAGIASAATLNANAATTAAQLETMNNSTKTSRGSHINCAAGDVASRISGAIGQAGTANDALEHFDIAQTRIL